MGLTMLIDQWFAMCFAGVMLMVFVSCSDNDLPDVSIDEEVVESGINADLRLSLFSHGRSFAKRKQL